MKLKTFIIAASVLALGSCQDDVVENVVSTPVQTGDEITFGPSLPNAIGTRTSYGEAVGTVENGGYYPIEWEEGDEIAIFCPQASQPASQLVNYKITPDENDPTHSVAVTKIGDVGLQWGNEDAHRFYGFYPASAVKGTETDGRIIGTIPVYQPVESWDDTGTDENGNKIYRGIPNMDLAYMWAYNEVSKENTPVGTDVSLEFEPLVTVLEITVNGPDPNMPAVEVSNITIQGVSGNVALAGDFECLISDRRGTCTPLDNGTVTNRISISCYRDGQPITLNPGEKIIVQAFIIPNETAISTRQVSITVATTGGAARTKTLQTDEILPHKVNFVSLPALNRNTDINYWMSDLDPNIYASEISWPGSKMTALTRDVSSDLYYQTASITEQFNSGVRAFIFQTQRYYDGGLFPPRYRLEVVAAGEGFLGGSVQCGLLEDKLNELNECMKNAKNAGKQEAVFVLVTWNDGLLSGGEDWMQTLADEVDDWKDTYDIYPDRVGPNTTLGDLAGHILIKANYNNDNMANALAADRITPMLFSLWPGVFMDNEPLRWGTSNLSTTAELKWYGQELTACGTGFGSQGTVEQKESYISQVFAEGVRVYQENAAHDTWLLNDLGGYYTNDNGENRVTRLTQDMNALGIRELQARTENASLGLIFLNFADRNENSGQLYRSDELIQTVIDNNFKFALRKRANGSGINSLSSRSIRITDDWDK